MSDTKDDGGPAYPISLPGWGDNGAQGMSLRDHFAAAAMGAFLSNRQMYLAMLADRGSAYPDEYIAREAYRQADAMLEARKP